MFIFNKSFNLCKILFKIKVENLNPDYAIGKFQSKQTYYKI